MEKILKIKEVANIGETYNTMSGYVVETDKHKYFVLIDDHQDCCENWGYMCSEDDTSYFIGANLKEIKTTDQALNVKKIEEIAPYGFDGGDIQFVTFNTSKGAFQLSVYNSHNGYYGHGISIRKETILMEKTL